MCGFVWLKNYSWLMDWKEYAKELLIFQVKVFSLPIEDVSKEKIEEFKNEFNEIKKMGNLDWDAEALVENYYDEIGKIEDKLEKLLNDEELILGNTIDDVTTGPGGVDEPVTLGEVAEMNMTNQEPRYFEDL
jgi:hypothetical protein